MEQHTAKTTRADVVRLGHELLARGFLVWEHPDFGGVDPKYHIKNSKHNRAEAIDVNVKGGGRTEDDELDELAVELVGRGFGVIWNRGAGDHEHHLHAETLGNPDQYAGRVRVKRRDTWPRVKVDGKLGPETITALQLALHTPATGKISAKTSSTVVAALQRYLNTEARAAELVVDGKLGPKTISALQRYLDTPVTGKITARGSSTVVEALQHTLNATGSLVRRAAEPIPDPPTASSTGRYVVRAGDTLAEIAAAQRTSVAALMLLNGITDPNRIDVGSVLYTRWVVGRGDTLAGIADAAGTTTTRLVQLNGIRNADALNIGELIRLP